MKSKPLRIGIIGAGRVSSRHVQAIGKREDAHVTIVADPITESARKLAETCNAEAISNSESVLEREDLDVVYICTPHYLHHPYAMKALQNGKHVFIEKPMANTVEECEEINGAAQEGGLVVNIGHHQRYFPHMKCFSRLIREGAIGEVRMLNDRTVFDNGWANRALWWKQKKTAGGGLLMNIGVHQIDRCLWLMDALPQSVFAHVRCALPELDVDTDYSVMLEMPGAATVNIVGTSYPSNSDSLFEAVGTKGRLWLDAAEEKIYLSTSGSNIKSEHAPGYMEAIEELNARFIDAIHTKGIPQVCGSWGETIVRVAQLAYRSSEKNAMMKFSDSNKPEGFQEGQHREPLLSQAR